MHSTKGIGSNLGMASPEFIKELEDYYRERGLAPHQVNGLARSHQDRPLARLMGNAAPILTRLMSGDSPKQIAADLGISREALNAWLLTHAADEWRAIAGGKALIRQQDAEETLETADNQLDVAKGRELARVASWTLERLVPKLYGQPGKDGSNGGIVINVSVDRSCSGTVTVENGTQQVIEG